MRNAPLQSRSLLQRRDRAMTLVESLLVVAILGLVAGLGAGSLTGASAAADRVAASAAVQDIDRLARLHALASGAVLIRAENGWNGIVVEHDGKPVARRTLPRGFAVRMCAERGASPVESVRVGADGRSEDYRIVITGADRPQEWIVRGLTGWIEVVSPASPSPFTPP